MSGKYIPIVEMQVLTPDGETAPFILTFYGIPLSEFMVTPGGGWKAREALERRGFPDYVCSPFLMRERRLGLKP